MSIFTSGSEAGCVAAEAGRGPVDLQRVRWLGCGGSPASAGPWVMTRGAARWTVRLCGLRVGLLAWAAGRAPRWPFAAAGLRPDPYVERPSMFGASTSTRLNLAPTLNRPPRTLVQTQLPQLEAADVARHVVTVSNRTHGARTRYEQRSGTRSTATGRRTDDPADLRRCPSGGERAEAEPSAGWRYGREPVSARTRQARCGTAPRGPASALLFHLRWTDVRQWPSRSCCGSPRTG